MLRGGEKSVRLLHLGVGRATLHLVVQIVRGGQHLEGLLTVLQLELLVRLLAGARLLGVGPVACAALSQIAALDKVGLRLAAVVLLLPAIGHTHGQIIRFDAHLKGLLALLLLAFDEGLQIAFLEYIFRRAAD